MDGQTSPTPSSSYPNPYANGYGGASVQPVQAAAGQPAPVTSTTTSSTVVKKASPIGPLLIGLLVGLLLGGAAGYFGGQFATSKEKTELQSRVTQLEQQVSTLTQQLAANGNSGTATGNTGTGTGTTAPTLGGITADPQTVNWLEYKNEEYHFSFKYPADYQVSGYQNSGDLGVIKERAGLSDSDNFWYAIALYKKGETVPAGLLRIYHLPPDGPDHRELQLFKFIDALPTTTQGQSAGAGVAPKADEKSITLNGTEGSQFTAVEGSGTTATPGGSTYTGYLFEEQFGNSYMTTYCDSDQTSQRNLVGCLWLSTFEIIR